MKIYLKIPGGGELRIEREPMNEERFEAVLILIALSLALLFIYKFISLFV